VFLIDASEDLLWMLQRVCVAKLRLLDQFHFEEEIGFLPSGVIVQEINKTRS
jgi:hypothetical protein